MWSLNKQVLFNIDSQRMSVFPLRSVIVTIPRKAAAHREKVHKEQGTVHITNSKQTGGSVI